MAYGNVISQLAYLLKTRAPWREVETVARLFQHRLPSLRPDQIPKGASLLAGADYKPREFWKQVAREGSRVLDQLSPVEVSTLVNALGRAQYKHEEFLRIVSAHLRNSEVEVPAVSLALVLNAFAKLAHRDPEFLAFAAQSLSYNLKELGSAQGLLMAVSAFAKFDFFNEQFFGALCYQMRGPHFASLLDEFSLPIVCNTLGKFQFQLNDTREILVRCALPLLPKMNSRSLTLCCSGLSKLGATDEVLRIGASRRFLSILRGDGVGGAVSGSEFSVQGVEGRCQKEQEREKEGQNDLEIETDNVCREGSAETERERGRLAQAHSGAHVNSQAVALFLTFLGRVAEGQAEAERVSATAQAVARRVAAIGVDEGGRECDAGVSSSSRGFLDDTTETRRGLTCDPSAESSSSGFSQAERKGEPAASSLLSPGRSVDVPLPWGPQEEEELLFLLGDFVRTRADQFAWQELSAILHAVAKIDRSASQDRERESAAGRKKKGIRIGVTACGRVAARLNETLMEREWRAWELSALLGALAKMETTESEAAFEQKTLFPDLLETQTEIGDVSPLTLSALVEGVHESVGGMETVGVMQESEYVGGRGGEAPGPVVPPHHQLAVTVSRLLADSEDLPSLSLKELVGVVSSLGVLGLQSKEGVVLIHRVIERVCEAKASYLSPNHAAELLGVLASLDILRPRLPPCDVPSGNKTQSNREEGEEGAVLGEPELAARKASSLLIRIAARAADTLSVQEAVHLSLAFALTSSDRAPGSALETGLVSPSFSRKRSSSSSSSLLSRRSSVSLSESPSPETGVSLAHLMRSLVVFSESHLKKEEEERVRTHEGGGDAIPQSALRPVLVACLCALTLPPVRGGPAELGPLGALRYENLWRLREVLESAGRLVGDAVAEKRSTGNEGGSERTDGVWGDDGSSVSSGLRGQLRKEKESLWDAVALSLCVSGKEKGGGGKRQRGNWRGKAERRGKQRGGREGKVSDFKETQELELQKSSESSFKQSATMSVCSSNDQESREVLPSWDPRQNTLIFGSGQTDIETPFQRVRSQGVCTDSTTDISRRFKSIKPPQFKQTRYAQV